MKLAIVISCWIFMAACQTPAELVAEEKQHAASKTDQSSQKPRLILRKLVGAETIKSHYPLQIDCKIYDKDVPSQPELFKQIAQLKQEPLKTAMHITARIPSITYSAYTENQEAVILLADYSQLRYRSSKESQALVDLIDRLCDHRAKIPES